MAKEYIILEEDDQEGSRTEIARADNIHVASSGEVTAAGYKEVAPRMDEPGRGSIKKNEPAPPSNQPMQIASGNNVITITIQVAPVGYNPHQQGGCGGCSKDKKGDCGCKKKKHEQPKETDDHGERRPDIRERSQADDPRRSFWQRPETR